MAGDPFRIDVHSHMIPSFYRAALADAGVATSGSIAYPEWTPDRAAAQMDQNRIASSILSISSPGVHFGDRSAAQSLARQCNDYASDLIVKHGHRFGSFAVLPLPDIDGAAAELAHALDDLKLDGVVLLASYDGRFLGDPSFDLIMAELDKRSAVVFVHPTIHPTTQQVNVDLPAFLVEFTFDTTRAAVNPSYS